MKPLTAIDIFAGGGGLTVGLKRAGFAVVAAVENEPAAFTTYKANHPEVRGFRQDIRTVKGHSLVAASPTGSIDLLAGCPPCQGFCSLTSKYKKHDPRNNLVLEMARLIREIQPRAVMMENVPGLSQKGKPLFDQLIATLEEMKYEISYSVLQVADYGVPQMRRRLVLLAGRRFPISIPAPTHGKSPKAGIKPWKTIRTTIKGLPDPITLPESHTVGGPQAVNWHVTRALSQENLRRIRKAIPGAHWVKIPKRLRPKCHGSKKAGFSNVYGRMCWDQASVTITGGCTTFSKGRFGHPEQDRTISVYEAALLQTFPDDYIFDTPYMEKACDIIGNALPCDFAKVLAVGCREALEKRLSPR